MHKPLTPEQEAARSKIIAELMAGPGPKPLKPIPPEIMAEILADQTPYEEARPPISGIDGQWRLFYRALPGRVDAQIF